MALREGGKRKGTRGPKGDICNTKGAGSTGAKILQLLELRARYELFYFCFTLASTIFIV